MPRNPILLAAAWLCLVPGWATAQQNPATAWDYSPRQTSGPHKAHAPTYPAAERWQAEPTTDRAVDRAVYAAEQRPSYGSIEPSAYVGPESPPANASVTPQSVEPPRPLAQGSAGPIPLAAPQASPGLPVSPPGKAADRNQRRGGSAASAVTVVGSLAMVVGIFLLVAWTMRRATPKSMMPLPGEVFEVLGRASMAARQQAYLLRCGHKLLLVSVTPAGAETLTEIDDPLEVDRLAGLCRQSAPGSATATFRHVFAQLSGTTRSGRGSFGTVDELQLGQSAPANYSSTEGRHG